MRRFSDEERERIESQLVETGRELLLTYGPDKTTVKDITDPVGIAKPTFYQFFESKADLYLEIFHREFDAYIEALETDLADRDEPREQLECLFTQYAEFGEGNEFIQRVFLRDDYQGLADFSPEHLQTIEQKELETLVPIVESIQDESDGPLADLDPVMVLGLMGSSVGLLILHREDFDRQMGDLDVADSSMYETLRTLLIETLARGLTTNT